MGTGYAYTDVLGLQGGSVITEEEAGTEAPNEVVRFLNQEGSIGQR